MTTSANATSDRRLSPARRRAALAATLVLLGGVSPWVAHPGGTTLGVEGAGLWTLAAGGVGLAGALLRHPTIARLHLAVLAAVPTALGAWQVWHLGRLGCLTGPCQPSFGLVLTLAGGLVASAALRDDLRGPRG